MLVISPLNIIQKDQQRKLSECGIKSCRLDIVANVIKQEEEGSEYCGKSSENIEDVMKGECSVVFCHPEALFNTSKGRELLNSEEFKRHVRCVVLDECHIIEKW